MKFNKIAELSQPLGRRNMQIRHYYTESPDNEALVSVVSEPLNDFPGVPYRVKILDSIPEGKKADGSFTDLASKLFDSFGEDYIEKQIQELAGMNKYLLENHHNKTNNHK